MRAFSAPGGHAGVGGKIVADVVALFPDRGAGGPLALGAIGHGNFQVVQVAVVITVFRRHPDHLVQGIGEPHPGQAEEPLLHGDAADLLKQGLLVPGPENGLVDLA